MSKVPRLLIALLLAAGGAGGALALAQQPASLPDYPLQFAGFTARFQSDGAFSLTGAGWPAFTGTWKTVDRELEIITPGASGGCDKPARYRFTTDAARTTLQVVTDDCVPRRMILD